MNYLSLVAVNSEEVQQWLHAFFTMEELCREVTVEELDAIANGLGESRAREGSSKRLKIKLENEVAIRTGITMAKKC